MHMIVLIISVRILKTAGGGYMLGRRWLCGGGCFGGAISSQMSITSAIGTN